MMNIKEFFRKILFYLSVPRCVGCNERLSINELALCNKCMRAHIILKERNCSLCAKTLNTCDCSNKYLKQHKIKRLVKVFRYIPNEEGTPSNNLIYNLKRNNRRDVVSFLADELSKSILSSVSNVDKFFITNVPRRKAAIKEYGYDHAAVLAKAIAKRLGIEYKALLTSKAKKAQKKMSHDERKLNARVQPKRHVNARGERIILIDDIVTTGASMSASADALKSLGAKEIVGAAISIAFRDEYTPIKKSEFTYW